MTSPEPQAATTANLRGVQLLIRLEEAVLAALLTVIIVLACYQISLRWLTQGGLPWIDPLLRYLVLWGGLIGAALATARDNHISMDLVGYLLGDKAKNWLGLLINIFSTVVAAFLVRATLLFIRSEFEYGGSGLLGLPTWVWNLIFPLAFTVICLHFLLNALQSVRILLTGPSSTDE
ncbi:TRAP transporter small permease [Desulfofustis glycolicus]|uniref:TRAP-type C4-dicarboxylate transport system, small permease component n=1 Tax=Desulfofustis glycolicus DSM 9705 TaxID=1121409 RepID=A0A1M5WIU5_9BACT|nr:TRAP transporter small permease [Desulfofustis glycolicus]MCB2216826.1 TRAP transporter small permease subunit [Desulfobulbaceae bacterium]SHH87371.1 TRAP-type C4-dicarboxylate transport system, small permease component [Desulfofustis glycolicus DSM 9705]